MLARRLSPFRAQAAAGEKKAGFLEGTPLVAAQVGDPKVAAMLLGPFTLLLEKTRGVRARRNRALVLGERGQMVDEDSRGFLSARS